MSLDFLGRGLKHPFEFMRRTGAPGVSVAASTQHAHIHESIHQILGTRVGERFMRPEFGSRLHELVFAQNDDVLKGLVRYHIIDAIRRWEKRVVVISVEFDETPENKDRNLLLVRIHYRVIQSQIEGNFVFPYYRG